MILPWPCNNVTLFWGSPTFQVSAPFSTICSAYAQARSKSTTSCCVVSLETLLDPGWRFLEESPCGIMGLHHRPLLTTLSSRAPISVTASLGQPGFLNNVILYPVRPQRLEAPLPPLRPRPKCNFIHPQQLSPFPERQKLPFSSDAILSGFEDIVSSGSDHFTMWVKVRPHEVLAEHVVDIHKVMTDFREASERRKASSSQTCGVKKYFSSQSPMQRRLNIYNWNPGPRRGKEDAFEKQISGEMAYCYPVTSIRPCRSQYSPRAISRDTFYPDINIKSIYFHNTKRDLPHQVMEGEQRWIMQGVLSRASFHPPVSGQKSLTVLSQQYQQHLRQEERHRQDAHSYSSCHYDFSGS